MDKRRLITVVQTALMSHEGSLHKEIPTIPWKPGSHFEYSLSKGVDRLKASRLSFEGIVRRLAKGKKVVAPWFKLPFDSKGWYGDASELADGTVFMYFARESKGELAGGNYVDVAVFVFYEYPQEPDTIS